MYWCYLVWIECHCIKCIESGQRCRGSRGERMGEIRGEWTASRPDERETKHAKMHFIMYVRNICACVCACYCSLWSYVEGYLNTPCARECVCVWVCSREHVYMMRAWIGWQIHGCVVEMIWLKRIRSMHSHTLVRNFVYQHTCIHFDSIQCIFPPTSIRMHNFRICVQDAISIYECARCAGILLLLAVVVVLLLLCMRASALPFWERKRKIESVSVKKCRGREWDGCK